MSKKTVNHFLFTADETIEFAEIFSEYMGTHNADIQISAIVKGDAEDVEDFERFYARENGMNEGEDDDTEDVIYPNGRYM